MKRLAWFERRRTSIWRQLWFALMSVFEGVVNIFISPFGYSFTLSLNWCFIEGRKRAIKAGINVDKW